MTELIQAIAGLWPLALIVVIFFGLVVYKSQLRLVLERFSKFKVKRGDTEFVVENASETQSKTLEGVDVAPPAAIPSRETTPPSKSIEESGARSMSSVYMALFSKDFEQAQAYFDEVQAAEQNVTQRIKNEAHYLAFRYSESENDAKALASLNALANAHTDSRPFVLGWLGWAYAQHKEFARARASLEKAVSLSQSDSDRTQNARFLSRVFRETGDIAAAEGVLLRAMDSVSDEGERSALFTSLGDVYEAGGDAVQRAIVLEKAFQLSPSKSGGRFAAAYAESQAQFEHAAISNYDVIVKVDENRGAALNNIAVQAETLKLPTIAISYYKRSIEAGESLAAANVAKELIKSGFIEEARETLDKVKDIKDVHANVNEAYAEAAKRVESEAQTWAKEVQRGAQEATFLQRFADARFPPTTDSGDWSGEWVSQAGATMTLAFNGTGLTGEITLTSTRRKIDAEITRRSCLGTVAKWEKHLFDSEKGYWSSSKSRCLGILSEDGARLELAIEGTPPEFQQFIRAAAVH